MRAIMVMYDSLNRHYLPNYGCDVAKMPNFIRLGKKSVTFDNSYAASLPCMPARRELHTGRINFLHRGWSPVEPFDDSMPEILKKNGIYSHLVSDHQHYWEDGGATYHTRYQSWELSRGQEGDPWKGSLEPMEPNYSFGPKLRNERMPFSVENWKHQDAVNRTHMKSKEDFPQAKTFQKGLEFIETNKAYDNWYLQIETFDPHEPFFTPKEYQELYREQGEEDFSYDWPPYYPVTETDDFVQKVRKKYFALLSMCDDYLGKVLDIMDKYDMWKDTMLIVNTDHGYLLGEHLWWSKSVMPVYNELAHTPLFIWDPRSGIKNERRNALVQTIDLAPTILDYYGLSIPKDMQGHSLTDVIREDKKVREYGVFGFFGSHINITDGRYIYMRAPVSVDNQPLNEYTLMPLLMRARMAPERLKDAKLQEPFSFTKDCPVLKLPIKNADMAQFRYGSKLYDLSNDPEQLHPIDDPNKEVELINEIARIMRENDAPQEQYIRLGIPEDGSMTREQLLKQRKEEQKIRLPQHILTISKEWEEQAVWCYKALVNILTFEMEESVIEKKLSEFIKAKEINKVLSSHIIEFMKTVVPKEDQDAAAYTMVMMARID